LKNKNIDSEGIGKCAISNGCKTPNSIKLFPLISPKRNDLKSHPENANKPIRLIVIDHNISRYRLKIFTNKKNDNTGNNTWPIIIVPTTPRSLIDKP